MNSPCANCQVDQGRYCECLRQQDEADGRLSETELAVIVGTVGICGLIFAALVGFVGRWLGVW